MLITIHGNNITHTFTSPGCYSITSTISNQISLETQTIEICAQDLFIELFSNHDECVIKTPQNGNSINFQANSNGKINWEFGDGAKKYNHLSTSHNYYNSGNFTVSLTASSMVQNKTVGLEFIVCIKEWEIVEVFELLVVQGVKIEDLVDPGGGESFIWLVGSAEDTVTGVYSFDEIGVFAVLRADFESFQAFELSITQKLINLIFFKFTRFHLWGSTILRVLLSLEYNLIFSVKQWFSTRQVL